MKISRKLAIKILEYLDKHKDFYFPFQIMCKEYKDEDGNSMEIESSEFKKIKLDKKYQTFELWENLQNLYEETIELMAKGFIEKITNAEDVVRNFIFYTTEGYTFQPGSENDVPDVENCQVLGWGNGKNTEEAFNDFKEQSPWLKTLSFDEVIGVELKDEKTYHFNLKDKYEK